MYNNSTLANAGYAVVTPIRPPDSVKFLLQNQSSYVPQNQSSQASTLAPGNRHKTPGSYNEFLQNQNNGGKTDYAKMLDAQIQEKKQMESQQNQRYNHPNKSVNNLNIYNPNYNNFPSLNTNLQGGYQSSFTPSSVLTKSLPQNQFTSPNFSHSRTNTLNSNVFLGGTNSLLSQNLNSTPSLMKQARIQQIQSLQNQNEQKETFFDKWISSTDKTFSTRPQQYRGLLKKENMEDSQIEMKERRQQELNQALQEQIMYKKQKEELEEKQRKLEDTKFLQNLQVNSRAQTGLEDGKQIKSIASKAERTQQRNLVSRRQDNAVIPNFDGSKELPRTPMKLNRKIIAQDAQHFRIEKIIDLPQSNRGEQPNQMNQYIHNQYQQPNQYQNFNNQQMGMMNPNMNQSMINPPNNYNMMNPNMNQSMGNPNMNYNYQNNQGINVAQGQSRNQISSYNNNNNAGSHHRNNSNNKNSSSNLNEKNLQQQNPIGNQNEQKLPGDFDMEYMKDYYDFQKKVFTRQMNSLQKDVQDGKFDGGKRKNMQDQFMKNTPRPINLIEDTREILGVKKPQQMNNIMQYEESPYLSSMGKHSIQVPLMYGEKSSEQMMQQQKMLMFHSELVPNKTMEKYSLKKRKPDFHEVEMKLKEMKQEMNEIEKIRNQRPKSNGDNPSQYSKQLQIFLNEQQKRGIIIQDETNLDNEFINHQFHDAIKKKKRPNSSRAVLYGRDDFSENVDFKGLKNIPQKEDTKKQSMIQEYLWEVMSRESQNEIEIGEEDEMQQIEKIVEKESQLIKIKGDSKQQEYESRRKFAFKAKGAELSQKHLQLIMREQEKEELRKHGASQQELRDIDRKYNISHQDRNMTQLYVNAYREQGKNKSYKPKQSVMSRLNDRTKKLENNPAEYKLDLNLIISDYLKDLEVDIVDIALGEPPQFINTMISSYLVDLEKSAIDITLGEKPPQLVNEVVSQYLGDLEKNSIDLSLGVHPSGYSIEKKSNEFNESVHNNNNNQRRDQESKYTKEVIDTKPKKQESDQKKSKDHPFKLKIIKEIKEDEENQEEDEEDNDSDSQDFKKNFKYKEDEEDEDQEEEENKSERQSQDNEDFLEEENFHNKNGYTNQPHHANNSFSLPPSSHSKDVVYEEKDIKWKSVVKGFKSQKTMEILQKQENKQQELKVNKNKNQKNFEENDKVYYDMNKEEELGDIYQKVLDSHRKNRNKDSSQTVEKSFKNIDDMLGQFQRR